MHSIATEGPGGVIPMGKGEAAAESRKMALTLHGELR